MIDYPSANVLALDTSTSMLRLAMAFGGDAVVKREEDVERSHGMMLMKKISDICESSGLNIKQIAGLVVCTGPGSFTGLRIGLASAKGIAVALKIPIASVSLFEIAARRLADVDQEVQVVVPFKRDELFVGVARGGLCEQSSIRAVPLDQIETALAGRPVIGVGLDPILLVPDLASSPLGSSLVFDAGDLLQIGVERLQAGDFADLRTLEPLYIQKSQAEINFDKRHGN
jgi:tRNA threonylcarbamoyladenosine biosynthesis protein TsaB